MKFLKIGNTPVFTFLLLLFFYLPLSLCAQQAALYKVLTLSGTRQGARDLPQDAGAAGVWQKLQKLATIGSVLETQAHPDDEHADLLTYLGRGKGYRTALLSLNRGESGANVLGSESYDALGVLRTEEFLLAAAYYGLDDLYFTKLVDYGFSKRVEETYAKWGRENILREMVRVIRTNRPMVIISRFHGSTRDGHGNHQAAGEMTQEAFRMAGDSSAFPELFTQEGLRPWKPFKLYRGGVRGADGERWQVQLNTGTYNPWLGQSYKNFSLLGYSMHRSQVGGNRFWVNGPSVQYYERLSPGAEKEGGFFDGLDTSVTAIFRVTGEQAPPGVEALLQQIESEVNRAQLSFRIEDPSAIVPNLVKGLSATRAALALLARQEEARFLLQVKEQQFMDAIHAAMGLTVQAMGAPAGAKEPRNLFEPPPVMGPAVAGKPFSVQLTVVNNSRWPISPQQLMLGGPQDVVYRKESVAGKALQPNEKLEQGFSLSLPPATAISQPYYYRGSLQEDVYQLRNGTYENLPLAPPVVQATLTYLVEKESITVRCPVMVRQANLPYGYNLYALKLAPAVAVNLRPTLRVVPLASKGKSMTVAVEVVNHIDSMVKGTLALTVPDGWTVKPQQSSFTLGKAGEKSSYAFTIHYPALSQKEYSVAASATLEDGTSFHSGYDLIQYRDLDQSFLYRPATTVVKGIDVAVKEGLRVGYVMGVGDEIPEALQQLGASVTLLDAAELSSRNLNRFDVIMVGVRAYAVRKDLLTYNQSLLEYARNGGHLVVLNQTPEFVPATMAPFPAQLPNNSEEVSEEDAPITFLQPAHAVLNQPNKITAKDFDHWVEQRGSKFFSEWDPAYVPIIASHDTGQPPQAGGWLMARYGKGWYTYFAYAFHRELPLGVTGAYRLLANIISYGK